MSCMKLRLATSPYKPVWTSRKLQQPTSPISAKMSICTVSSGTKTVTPSLMLWSVTATPVQLPEPTACMPWSVTPMPNLSTSPHQLTVKFQPTLQRTIRPGSTLNWLKTTDMTFHWQNYPVVLKSTTQWSCWAIRKFWQEEVCRVCREVRSPTRSTDSKTKHWLI